MIRPLRRRHLGMIASLALVVGPLGIAALASRPAPARQATLPAGLAPPASAATSDGADLGTDPPGRVRRIEGGAAVEIVFSRPVPSPDLLVYWLAGGPSEGAGLPEESVLLGATGDRLRIRFELPGGATGRGELLLFSLAHESVVGRTVLTAEER